MENQRNFDSDRGCCRGLYEGDIEGYVGVTFYDKVKKSESQTFYDIFNIFDNQYSILKVCNAAAISDAVFLYEVSI